MTTCPKCQHVRNSNDDPNVPEYQCPECGVVYKKYLAKLSESFADLPESNKEKKKKNPEANEANEHEDISVSTSTEEKPKSHPNPKLVLRQLWFDG